VREGARWWAAAFEAAGFDDAFRVELRPPDVPMIRHGNDATRVR
jgi:hypothetical protein